MSVKMMGWIFDLNMPPSAKLVSLAYADHADHEGKSIYPGVAKIAKKTGLSERHVVRITHWLEDAEFLIRDGHGPMGTNKWRINIEWKGVTLCQGDTVSGVTSETLGGDIDAITLTDTMSPDSLTVINQDVINTNIGVSQNVWTSILTDLKENEYKRNQGTYREYFEPTYLLAIEDLAYIVAVPDEHCRAWLDDRAKKYIENALAGVDGKKHSVEFRIVAEVAA